MLFEANTPEFCSCLRDRISEGLQRLVADTRKAKTEWIQKVPGLNSYQDLLIDKAGRARLKG